MVDELLNVYTFFILFLVLLIAAAEVQEIGVKSNPIGAPHLHVIYFTMVRCITVILAGVCPHEHCRKSSQNGLFFGEVFMAVLKIELSTFYKAATGHCSTHSVSSVERRFLLVGRSKLSLGFWGFHKLGL